MPSVLGTARKVQRTELAMATTTGQRAEVPIERLAVAAFTIPTEARESDGTLKWDSTTLVVVEVEAAGVHGLGYTYADAAAAGLRLLRDRAPAGMEIAAGEYGYDPVYFRCMLEAGRPSGT